MLFSHQNDPHRKEGLLTFALIADAKNEKIVTKIATRTPQNDWTAQQCCKHILPQSNGQISQLKASKGDI